MVASDENIITIRYTTYQSICVYVGYLNEWTEGDYTSHSLMTNNFSITVNKPGSVYHNKKVVFMGKSKYRKNNIDVVLRSNNDIGIIVTSADFIGQVENSIKSFKFKENVLVCDHRIFLSINHTAVPDIINIFKDKEEYYESENYGLIDDDKISECRMNDPLVIKYNILNGEQLVAGNIILLREMQNQTTASLLIAHK